MPRTGISLSHFYLFSTQTIEEVFSFFSFFLRSFTHTLTLSLPALSFCRHHSLFFYLFWRHCRRRYFLCYRCIDFNTLSFIAFALQCIAFYFKPEGGKKQHADNLNIAFHLVNTRISAHPIQPSNKFSAGFWLFVLSFVDRQSRQGESKKVEKEVKCEKSNFWGKNGIIKNHPLIEHTHSTEHRLSTPQKWQTNVIFGYRLLLHSSYWSYFKL